MDLNEINEWGAIFDKVEPQPGKVTIQVDTTTDYFDWIDIRKANIGAMRWTKSWNGTWALQFLLVTDELGFDQNNFKDFFEVLEQYKEKDE